LRSVLQPVLFVGIASILHGILFLIPSGGPGKRDTEMTRGMRVKTYVDGPRAAMPAAPRAPERVQDAATPTVPADMGHSIPGADVARSGAAGGGSQGDQGGPRGAAGPSQGQTVGSGGPATESEFGQYLAHLRSDDVQGWARQSAKASRQGWKGSAAGSGGWAAGAGTGSGSGAGSGKGSGRGRGGTAGEAILDPRVRMVIIQYPIGESGQAEVGKGRNIENRLRPVPYPDLKVKQSRFTSGWWNVYIELWTTKDGQIARYNVLRPETNGPLERIFVDQVKRELQQWAFEPGASEVHVDVRFYVE
jgi:hypothetical protein